MDPTSRFFEKLRKVCVTVETETAKLQDAFRNRNNVDSDTDTDTDRAMQTYHELYSEVRELKGKMRDKVVQQKTEEVEVTGFIKACMVVEQRFREDIDRLRGHCENYGYSAPQNTQQSTKAIGKTEKEEGGARIMLAEEGNPGETGEDLAPGTPLKTAPVPPFVDPMRTPQLADFGLSELHLRKVLGAAVLSLEAPPPRPETRLPSPSLGVPVTPKCTLRMEEEDEPLTPQMHDFGIVEHTMCLNNDFTMDLHRKDVEKAQRCLPIRPLSSMTDGLSTTDMETPEPPVFSTLGLMLKKVGACSSLPPPGEGIPETCNYLGNLQTTPEVPVFQTPHMNNLLSTRKGIREAELGYMHNESENVISELTTPPNRETVSRCPWEYNVPEVSIGAVQNNTPEMPSLESVLGRSLLSRTAGRTREHNEWKGGPTELSVPPLQLDGPTQEFSLGTPRVRGAYMEADPSTPEMPDLSSVTMDICKLVSQSQVKNPCCAVQPQPRPPGKENRGHSVPAVTESEFQSLPSYLRQMSLYSLNQVLQRIHTASAAEKSRGKGAEFLMDDLKKITGIGPKAPIYFLCLTELKRLDHIQGAGIHSVYKLPLAS